MMDYVNAMRLADFMKSELDSDQELFFFDHLATHSYWGYRQASYHTCQRPIFA